MATDKRQQFGPGSVIIRVLTSFRAQHSLCVVCLGVEHALSRADCEHCERLPVHLLHYRLATFKDDGQARSARGSGPAAAEAQRRLMSWGSQVELAEEHERGLALSHSPTAGLEPVDKSRFADSSPRGEVHALGLWEVWSRHHAPQHTRSWCGLLPEQQPN